MRGLVLNIESLESQVFRAILPCAGEDSGHSPSTDADSGLEQESLDRGIFFETPNHSKRGHESRKSPILNFCRAAQVFAHEMTQR